MPLLNHLNFGENTINLDLGQALWLSLKGECLLRLRILHKETGKDRCALQIMRLANGHDLGQASRCREALILRKEVIQPQVLLRLPCYDFTPVINTSLDACLPKRVGATSSANVNFHGVTGGVYKARERIHRAMLLRDY